MWGLFFSGGGGIYNFMSQPPQGMVVQSSSWWISKLVLVWLFFCCNVGISCGFKGLWSHHGDRLTSKGSFTSGAACALALPQSFQPEIVNPPPKRILWLQQFFTIITIIIPCVKMQSRTKTWNTSTTTAASLSSFCKLPTTPLPWWCIYCCSYYTRIQKTTLCYHQCCRPVQDTTSQLFS